MTNYLQDIKPLEDQGLTDQQILDILVAKTEVDLLSEPVRKYFHASDLWLVDPETGVRTDGAIGQAYGGLTTQQKELARKLHNWVYAQDSIDTENDPIVSQLFLTIMQGLVNLSIITPQHALDIYAFAGGRPHKTLDLAGIASLRQGYQDAQDELARQQSIEALKAEIENDYINPAIADGTSTAADVRTAIKAGL